MHLVLETCNFEVVLFPVGCLQINRCFIKHPLKNGCEGYQVYEPSGMFKIRIQTIKQLFVSCRQVEDRSHIVGKLSQLYDPQRELKDKRVYILS